MPQTAIDADVDEFLDAMRSWSPANRANAAGVFNRFTRWLAERDTIPARATRRQCRDYLDHVAHTPMAARPGRPATPPKSSTQVTVSRRSHARPWTFLSVGCRHHHEPHCRNIPTQSQIPPVWGQLGSVVHRNRVLVHWQTTPSRVQHAPIRHRPRRREHE